MTLSFEKIPYKFVGTFTSVDVNPEVLDMPDLPDASDCISTSHPRHQAPNVICTEIDGHGHNATVLIAQTMGRPSSQDDRPPIKPFHSAHVDHETRFIIKMFHYEKEAKKEYYTLRKLGGLQGKCPEVYAIGSFSGTNNDGEPISGPAIAMERLPTKGEDGFYLLDDIDGIYEAMGVQRIHCPNSIQTASFVYQLSLTVSLLANSGYSHKDLKPANVIVGIGPNDPNNGSWEGIVCTRVLLIDLGSASKTTDDATPIYRKAKKLQSEDDRNPHMGTPPYSAPELFDVDLTEGAPDDPRTGKPTGTWWEFRNKRSVDVWSVGTLLYFFHMGEKPPFTELEDRTLQYYSHTGKKPPFGELSKEHSKVPKDSKISETNLRERIMEALCQDASAWALEFPITYLPWMPSSKAQIALEKIFRLSTIPNPMLRQVALPDGVQSIIGILNDALPAEFPKRPETGPNPYNDSTDSGATPKVKWTVTNDITKHTDNFNGIWSRMNDSMQQLAEKTPQQILSRSKSDSRRILMIGNTSFINPSYNPSDTNLRVYEYYAFSITNYTLQYIPVGVSNKYSSVYDWITRIEVIKAHRNPGAMTWLLAGASTLFGIEKIYNSLSKQLQREYYPNGINNDIVSYYDDNKMLHYIRNVTILGYFLRKKAGKNVILRVSVYQQSHTPMILLNYIKTHKVEDRILMFSTLDRVDYDMLIENLFAPHLKTTRYDLVSSCCKVMKYIERQTIDSTI